MLRIPNLLRSKLPNKTPLRAGLPGWHRPDPPPSVEVPLDHELTDQQLVFHFFDRNMSEFFLTQPEVYEGDTLLQASPMLLKGLGLWIGLGLLTGSVLYLTSPFRSTLFTTPEIQDKFQNEKRIMQQKQWLKWGRKNEIGLQLSSEYYPQHREGVTEITNEYKKIKNNIDSYATTNNEVKAYFTRLREQCQHTVEQRLANPEASHDTHH